MRDTAPTDFLAYVAVSLPDEARWQGFFARQAYRSGADQMLDRVLRANRAAAARGMLMPVDHGLPNVAPEDQPTVGGLSVALCELFGMATKQPGPIEEQIGPILTALNEAVLALHLASGQRWLLVTGRRPPEAGRGFATTIDAFEAENLDEARELIASELDRAKNGHGIPGDFMSMIRKAAGEPGEG